MKTRFFSTMWSDLVGDPESVCVLSLSNLATLWLLLLVELCLRLGGR